MVRESTRHIKIDESLGMRLAREMRFLNISQIGLVVIIARL